MTQFCIEEAALIYYDAFSAAQAEQAEIEEREANAKPGDITDPVMADAMQKAREQHAAQFGVDPMKGRR